MNCTLHLSSKYSNLKGLVWKNESMSIIPFESYGLLKDCTQLIRRVKKLSGEEYGKIDGEKYFSTLVRLRKYK